MISLLKQIFEKLSVNIRMFNRENSPSDNHSQHTANGDNVGRDKHVHNYPQIPTTSVAEKSRVIMAWATTNTVQENHKIIAYEFDLLLQNKSEKILRDLWLNFSSSGFDLQVEQTNQTKLFDGWNVYNHGLNLLTKNDFRFAPQALIAPFKIRILFKKEQLPQDAWIYISFGGPEVHKYEIEGRLNRDKLDKFIAQPDHSTEAFLKLIGLGKEIL